MTVTFFPLDINLCNQFNSLPPQYSCYETSWFKWFSWFSLFHYLFSYNANLTYTVTTLLAILTVLTYSISVTSLLTMLQIAYAFPLIINIFITSLSGHGVTGVVWFTPAFLDTCCFAVKFFGLNGLVVLILYL